MTTIKIIQKRRAILTTTYIKSTYVDEVSCDTNVKNFNINKKPRQKLFRLLGSAQYHEIFFKFYFVLRPLKKLSIGGW